MLRSKEKEQQKNVANPSSSNAKHHNQQETFKTFGIVFSFHLDLRWLLNSVSLASAAVWVCDGLFVQSQFLLSPMISLCRVHNPSHEKDVPVNVVANEEEKRVIDVENGCFSI